MKTRCPNCQTRLHVTPEQLHARGGKVRCGICHTVFSANDYAQNPNAPAQPQAARPHRYREESPPGYLEDEPYVDERRAGRQHQRIYQDEPFIEDSRDYDEGYDAIRHDDYDDEVYYREYRRARRRGGVFWLFVVLILLVALLWQGAVVFRNQLVHYFPAARLVITQVCAIAQCELGGTRSISQFSLENVSLKVRSDVPPQPSHTALLLQARLVNKENRVAEWPALVLSLKDERGQVDRRRIIKVEEYLPAAMRVQPMAALSQYPIVLRLNLAGAMATGFELTPYYEE